MSFVSHARIPAIGAGIALIAGITGTAVPALASEAGPAIVKNHEGAQPAGRGAVFSYVGEAYRGRSRGASAVLPVAKPHLSRQANHSLTELTVESASLRDIVEVGWVRSAGIKGGPRLFVSYWAGGADHAADSGFHSTSKRVKPFQALRPGSSLHVGLAVRHGRWNVSVNGRRIGYFPASNWGGSFRSGGVAQAFGEVESYGLSHTWMVNGQVNRKISGFHLVGARTPAGSFYSSDSHGYHLGSHGAHWFRLGGRGR